MTVRGIILGCAYLAGILVSCARRYFVQWPAAVVLQGVAFALRIVSFLIDCLAALIRVWKNLPPNDA